MSKEKEDLLKQAFKIKIKLEVVVTNEDIDDIMCSALEGGITFWCDSATVIGDCLGQYGHEQISRGGQLKLHDFEQEQDLILTREKFLVGLQKYLANPTYADIIEIIDHKGRLDTSYADAEVADSIVQLAVFGMEVYG